MQWKFISHWCYSPILFGRGNVYRWVSELHTVLQGPRLFIYRIMQLSSIPILQDHLKKGRKMCSILCPDQDVRHITSAHILLTTTQSPPYCKSSKEMKCGCQKKLKQGCWIHYIISWWLTLFSMKVYGYWSPCIYYTAWENYICWTCLFPQL